ncbi:MAG: hypothetical protein EU532_11320 [Promethearchaeota archaeon]|nr:MAG: hypothetical protein EU532_11320 [Candidatus Lokiarchaeota archaeon]
MELASKFSEIKELLSVDNGKFDLDQVIFDWPEERKLAVVNKVLNFINNFYMFKELKPFMNSVYICIKKTLEIQTEDIDDYDELLVKNSIMRFVQEYITYSNLSQKEEILNFLAGSLGKLQLQPLIINLGLLLKPMYSDQEYLNKIKDYEEIEVSYILNDENEIRIKKEIDKWLETQHISLDNQDEIRIKLIEVYDKLVGYFKLSMNSEIYSKLLKEVKEMLAMRVTVLSLMDSVDESFEPVPIRRM